MKHIITLWLYIATELHQVLQVTTLAKLAVGCVYTMQFMTSIYSTVIYYLL